MDRSARLPAPLACAEALLGAWPRARALCAVPLEAQLRAIPPPVVAAICALGVRSRAAPLLALVAGTAPLARTRPQLP
eukprot:13232408-Alexandrium_andersonii.AAC.1